MIQVSKSNLRFLVFVTIFATLMFVVFLGVTILSWQASFGVYSAQQPASNELRFLDLMNACYILDYERDDCRERACRASTLAVENCEALYD